MGILGFMLFFLFLEDKFYIISPEHHYHQEGLLYYFHLQVKIRKHFAKKQLTIHTAQVIIDVVAQVAELADAYV
jgi:hypothetical protein